MSTCFTSYVYLAVADGALEVTPRMHERMPYTANGMVSVISRKEAGLGCVI